jgi:flagellum-specific ATP synthase
MTQFTSDSQQQLISRFRHVYSTYQENRDLIAVGAYQPGSNPQLDEAVALWPSLIDFLRQSRSDCVDAARSLDALRELFDAASAEESGEQAVVAE